MTLTSPVNGLPYHYAVGPTGWTYTAPNGEQFEEANLWEELALPDFNLTYGGQPVAIAELSWNLSYGVTDDPLRPPGTSAAPPASAGPELSAPFTRSQQPKLQPVTPGCMAAALIHNFIGDDAHAGVTVTANIGAGVALRLLEQTAPGDLLPGPGWLYIAGAVLWDGGMTAKSYLDCRVGEPHP